MKVAVIGHLEWGRFVRVGNVPKAGEIVHASDAWEEVAGGGAVAAMQLAILNGSCIFFTAVGDDELGRRSIKQLQQNGVEVYASIDNTKSTRSIMVHIDEQHERTITVIGDIKPSGDNQDLPWEKLSDVDAVYFVSGDESALRQARKAKQLISTTRILPLLQKTALPLDALLASSRDTSESYKPGDLSPEPNIVINTEGSKGGVLNDGSRYDAKYVDNNMLVDTYGCGDSFAAAVAYGLGAQLNIKEILELAAQTGALAAQRRGAFGN